MGKSTAIKEKYKTGAKMSLWGKLMKNFCRENVFLQQMNEKKT